MKIRIKGNSLRLRLTQGEVNQLVIKGLVSETIEFGPEKSQQLTYTIVNKPINEIACSFLEQNILVEVPATVINTWAKSDQVSIRHSQYNKMSKPLDLLIEKDFKCLTVRPGEDETDLFPNPSEKEHH